MLYSINHDIKCTLQSTKIDPKLFTIYIFLQTKFVALNEKIPTATFSQDLTLTDDTKRFVIETANPAV